MRSRAAAVALLLALAGLAALQSAILPDPSRRNYRVLPDMADSPGLEPQAPVPVLDDGLVLDPRPPRGSVARDFLPFPFPPTSEGAEAAGRTWRSPYAAGDPGVLVRGAEVFTNFCAVCHGAGGTGDGPVTSRGVPPPPSLLAQGAVEMSDGRMYHIITAGQGNMGAYASQVQREDRWRVIAYIRWLQGAAGAPAAAAAQGQP